MRAVIPVIKLNKEFLMELCQELLVYNSRIFTDFRKDKISAEILQVRWNV